MAELAIPGGDRKGTLLTEALESDIRYWLTKKTDELGSDPNGKFAGYNRTWIAGAKKVLAARGIDVSDLDLPSARPAPSPRPAPAARPPQSSALARGNAPQQIIAGTFSNAEAASRALMEASKKYHLVSPATIVGRLPEGCEVVVSVVQIDPYGVDVYAITGDRKNPKDTDTVGLDRVALARIAAAAGVTWVSSRRTDDGSHPHYCAWEAVARFPNFDMTAADIPGNVDIDTREDGEIRGPAAQEIRKKQADKPDGGDTQLLELRKFLMRHCESKAMNKAIGNKGVRRSYKRKDLEKPFAVARLIFTGHSEDPEARREFRQMIGQRFLGASHQLYGAPPSPPPAMAMQQPPSYQFAPHSPPPIGMSIDQTSYEEEEEQPYADVPDARPSPKPAAAPTPQAQPEAAKAEY